MFTYIYIIHNIQPYYIVIVYHIIVIEFKTGQVGFLSFL